TNPETGVHPTIDILDEAGDSRFKDVVINVQETRTGSLMFGVGYNSNAGPTGSIVLNERNFDITRFPRSVDDLLSGQAFRGAGRACGGAARARRVGAVPGPRLRPYPPPLREPSLFDSPFSLTESAYFSQRIFNEYEEQRVGDRLTIGRRLNQYWTASVTGRVE